MPVDVRHPHISHQQIEPALELFCDTDRFGGARGGVDLVPGLPLHVFGESPDGSVVIDDQDRCSSAAHAVAIPPSAFAGPVRSARSGNGPRTS